MTSRASATGPLIDGLLAGRLTGSTTDRNGVLKNTKFGGTRNDVNNAAIRGYIHDDDTRKGILDAAGLPDDGSVNPGAVDLNNLDDWTTFHKEVLSA